VTHHLRERGNKEKIILTPMPHKKGWDVNTNNGVLKKQISHPWLVNKEKGVLRKKIGGKLCQISKGDMSQKRKGY